MAFIHLKIPKDLMPIVKVGLKAASGLAATNPETAALALLIGKLTDLKVKSSDAGIEQPAHLVDQIAVEQHDS